MRRSEDVATSGRTGSLMRVEGMRGRHVAGGGTRGRRGWATAASALVLLAMVSLDAQAASAPHFAAPAEYGVVDLGDPVHFQLDSPDCARVPIRAELVSDDLTVPGPP